MLPPVFRKELWKVCCLLWVGHLLWYHSSILWWINMSVFLYGTCYPVDWSICNFSNSKILLQQIFWFYVIFLTTLSGKIVCLLIFFNFYLKIWLESKYFRTTVKIQNFSLLHPWHFCMFFLREEEKKNQKSLWGEKRWGIRRKEKQDIPTFFFLSQHNHVSLWDTHQ